MRRLLTEDPAGLLRGGDAHRRFGRLSSSADYYESQNTLAILTFDRLETGWRRATSVFVSLGVTARIERAVETAGTVTHGPPADLAEFEAWSALREAMTEKERGARFTGVLRLEPTGAYRFEFVRDDEPRWPLLIDIEGNLLESLPVETAELREDLSMHPRAASHTPAWLVERLGSAPIGFRDRWTETLAPLAESPNWNIVRDMVRDVIQVIGDDSQPLLESDVVAEGVSSDLIGSTRASQLMRLLRDASAAGVVEEPASLRSDESRPSSEVLKEDDVFRQNILVLTHLIDQLATQEIANVVAA